MAQVKKFQTPAGPIEGTAASNPAGTPAEGKKKYGRWIRNGVAYEMDDEKMKDLEKHIMSLKPELQPYAAEEYKRLLSGKDVTIDTMLNQRDGVDDYVILNDRQEKRLQNGKTKEGILNSLFNTPTHKFNVATYELGKWNPSKNVATSKSDEVKKTKLTKRTGSFAYDLTDKNQNRYKDYQNQDEMRYLEDIFNYLDGVNREQFDITGFDGMTDIESVYKQKGGKEFAKQLINDILAGKTVSGDYKDFLDVIGLSQSFGTNPEITQQKIDDEVATKKNTDWTNSGYAGAWSTVDRDKYFTYNSDGSFAFKGSLPSDINLSTGNYHFNDEFVEENPMYSYLSGKINYDGKWYSEKDLLNPESLLYKTLAAKDYFNMNKRGEYGNANNILKSSWKGQEDLIPAWGEGTEDYLGDFYGKRFLYENMNYNMPDTKIKIQTGLDESGAPIYVEKDIDDNWVIRRGVDLSSTNFLSDGTGRRPWSWKITDAYGNEINDIDGLSIKNKPLTYDSFIGLYDGSTATDQSVPTPRTRVSGDQYNPYYNRYADANDFGFTAYRAKDKDSAHVSIPTNIGGVEGQVYTDMPIDVYNVISNRSFVKSILDSDISTKFFRLIREGKDKIGAATLATYLPKINDQYNLELAQKIIEYFKNRKTIDSPESFKKGGIIKAQTGTVVRNLEYVDSQKTLDNAKTLNELYKNPYASQSVRKDGKWRDENFRKSVSAALGETDAAELWGLGLDAAGFIGGMIPGLGDLTNVALSTVGANIAYGIADRRKVKAGAVPTGTTIKNIIKNTALDAASILPVVGDAANGANWAKRLIYLLKRSKPALEWIKAGIGAVGVYGGTVALDKVISGEDLTTDDIKALMYGVMAATGLVRQGAHNFNESRLAAKSHPSAEQIPNKTRYKTTENGTEVEKDLVFTADDIAKAINWRNRGDVKSKAELVKLIKEKAPGISDEEVNRIMGSSNALRELGLVRDTPWYRGNGYVEAKPEKVPEKWEYFFKPGERQKALTERTPSQIAEAATSDRNMGKVGAEWIRAKGEGAPEGYSLSDNTFWQRGSVSKSNSGTEQQNRGTNNAQNNQQSNSAQQPSQANNSNGQNATQQSAPTQPGQQSGSTNQPAAPSVETPTNRTTAPEPVITLEAPTRNFSMEEFNTKFEQYAKILGAQYSKKHKKSQFERRIDMLSKDPNFKKWVQDDPDFATDLINSETKRAAQLMNKPEAQLRADVKQKLGFKKGGIIKASLGQTLNKIGESIKTGIEKWNDPSVQNLRDNTVRFAIGDFYNRKSTNDQTKAVDESLKYMQPVKSTEYYMPNYLNAGDAEKQFAQSQFQYRPAVTNDPNSYQAWKKEAYDKGNLSLANATRQYAQQNVNNGLQWVTDRRNYANAEAAGMTEFRKAIAAGINTKAGIKDIQNRATAESIIQLIGERQKQRDVDIAAINAANKAKTDYENELFMQDEMQKAMAKYFTEENKYDPTNPAHEAWIRQTKSDIQRTYLNRGWSSTYNGLTSQQQRMYDRKYGKPVFKSGGKMRSTSDLITINREKASDQIRVNKAKSQDRIWESSLKDARKALDKMSDRTHKILMKLLS